MGWGYDLPSIERILRAADYNFQEWLRTDVVQRWLAIDAAALAAGAEGRLAVAMANLRSASLLVGGAELALTVGVPLAVWVGVFAALGAPYAEARALVRNENFETGFSRGFVTGLLKWAWRLHTVPRFFRFGPGQLNPFDESLSYVAANAYNEGLRAGYVHASALNEVGRKGVLSRLRSLSPSTKAGRWGELDQRDYVIELAGAGRRHKIFRTAD
jgi:hypothetical protein